MKNVGPVDRLIRAVAGIALLIAAFTAAPLLAGWPHYVALGVGTVLVLTAVAAFCPAYLPFGIRTCRTR
ncbi:DUF2892 domain-containing protein [Acuticoccus sediminis]|uniref:DUF2892 domain-containing protein n=1 Tax=Acuticoccus sediminis TaxID=2184697 RepID=A0A8B2NG71_9HYPH|nr:DUF2892 domain-containing protein [Acuticoccus sediminis]RAH97869.1 DUF2892 domain-containing protein [Acuticoccus sediminis]